LTNKKSWNKVMSKWLVQGMFKFIIAEFDNMPKSQKKIGIIVI